MILIEEDPVVVHTTSVTATTGMLAVLSDTPVAGTDVTALLAMLLESGSHFGGGFGEGTGWRRTGIGAAAKNEMRIRVLKPLYTVVCKIGLS